MHRVRRLTQALIASGAFNIALVAFLFYWVVKERPPTPYCERKPAIQEEQQRPLAVAHGNNDLLRQYGSLSMDQLMALLNGSKLVENGLKERDLALAALVAFHHFDLSRALSGFPIVLEKRKIGYGTCKDGTSVEVLAFTGLNDQHFHAILHFAKTEKWPLTSQGLWLQIHRLSDCDPTLSDAFFLTPEFLAIETLFSRSETSVSKDDLFKVAMEGQWEKLADFANQQRLLQDLSPARRQRFLLEHIRSRSEPAALLMLKTDGEFAVKKLDDEHILMMLELLDQKSPEAEKFARELIISPRSDAVWKMAATRLYGYAKEPIPDGNLYEKALARFAPGSATQVPAKEQTPTIAAKPPQSPPKPKEITPVSKPTISKPKEIAAVAKPQQPAQPKDLVYIVQDGDNLWKISKKFKVDVDIIRKLNRLQSDTLKSGTTLKIPATAK